MSTLAPSGPRPGSRATVPAPAPGAVRRSAFRPDIEGLRAFAVLSVLAFHASVPGLAGGFTGVDVFFVISGYLITGLLVGEAVTTGRIRLAEFFSRRARRLLPSAAVVLVAVAVAGAWLTVPLRRTDLENDVVAAALSVANWRFINQRTDYLAAGQDESPLLHFWSLAVEEQFCLCWAPLLAVLALLVARAARRGRALRPLATAVTALLTLGTFALSLHWTGGSVSLAYLATPSRAWQFGVGALLALLPWHLLRGPRVLRLLCGWAGAGALVWCVLRYDASTPYPGRAALVPTLGTAAVILAGTPGRRPDGPARYGVGRLLGLRGPRAVGRLSYTLYLWHWPVLVLAEARFGALGWPARAALTLASVLPALATTRWVERPLRRSRTVSELPRRGLALGVAAVVIPVVLALVVGTGTLRLLGPATPVDVKGLPPGAASGPSLLTRTGTPLEDGPVVPSPLQARASFPPDGACEVAPPVTSSPPCLFGAVDSPDRIVLLGDSHAGQWFSPLLSLAAKRGWALQELVKQGCPLPALSVVNPQLGRTYHECDTWRADSLARLAKGPKPRMVVVSSLNRYTDDRALLLRGWERTLKPLRALGVPVVYIEDTPVPGTDVPACVSGHLTEPEDCAFGRERARRPDPLAGRIAAGGLPGVRAVSVNPVLCPAGGPTCPAVRDRILLYRDDTHLTDVAAVVLAPRLERLLLPPARGGWSELMREEFDGPAGSRPASSRWLYDRGTCYPGCPAPRWGTGEVETMTDSTDNVRLDGKGALEIVPTRRDGRWYSGRIESRRSDFAPPPGGVLRIEASIALPDVTGPAAGGYWPAFWTLGAGLRDGYTGWPAIGEIDVMESVNGRDTVFGTLHCGTAEGGPCEEPAGLTSPRQTCQGCRGSFHTYAVEVDTAPGAEEVRWYLDGRVYHRVKASAMDAATWDRALKRGQFLILNVAVGGGLPAADGATAGPATEAGHPMRVARVTVSARQGAGR
ncbi:acyltransferase family protein [Streptomyces sp. ITFR-16]|uniref:acyltransferase family protein n=1 Tax=Streptomyces sp. ITFR-16 TaxID=3075198 RepID=UPI00288B3088|nr:acyltransferase family protein [Streptomyces sp. ITFR-16]WNI24670.1 SGNH hydrolase domain-containing protein [Streptomyces sp. ITFR-16]